MKNLFISNLHEKDVEHCTTDLGLKIRRDTDKAFKKLCNIFTNANIIKENKGQGLSDEEYFSSLDLEYIDPDNYAIKKGKNNIIVERYPNLESNEPYIFVCNHTCPEDIETILNILDRNAYLILGSIESLQYNPEMYLSFLNGMIPFDIMKPSQRKQVYQKMLRVLKTNSILIFPEGSHNYSPNNLINPLFDGPVNLSLQTNRKIVIVSLVKDQERNISYIDVSNPIDISKVDVDIKGDFSSETEIEKQYVKSLSSIIRDKMATAVFHIIKRHFETLNRSDFNNIEEELRMKKIVEAFSKLKWDRDVFEAEYLTKKNNEQKQHEEIIRTISNLTLNPNAFIGKEGNKNWILLEEDLMNKDVVHRMREYWRALPTTKETEKTLKKRK